MRAVINFLLIGAIAVTTASCLTPGREDGATEAGSKNTAGRDALDDVRSGSVGGAKGQIQLGPRPYFLVSEMEDGALKEELLACFDSKPRRSLFSIGHRGAPLQFPEHTKESYEAAYRMGAGIIECDVTFTKDRELVCRHSQDDLATTTNILLTPLAETCTVPFTPAQIGPDGVLVEAARAVCRTSDISLEEFQTLRGKMDAFDPRAQTAEEFVDGTAGWRTDLYSGPTSGTLLTHAQSIALFKELGVGMTPELKAPVVAMPFEGDFSQQEYAQKMIDEYKAAGVAPRDVWPQSFDKDDVLYWIRNEPEYGRQAVYLDDAGGPEDLPDFAELSEYKSDGINIWGPPTFALLALDGNGDIVASEHAQRAQAIGLDIITWTLERSGTLADGDNGFYYQTIDEAITREGDVMEVIDVLARDVGVLGIFSDWPATVSFYASCRNPARGTVAAAAEWPPIVRREGLPSRPIDISTVLPTGGVNSNE